MGTITKENYSNKDIIKYLLLFLLFVTFVFAYFPVWSDLIKAWSNSDEYSHGFFILPVAAYIIWREKETLSGIQINRFPLGAPFVVLTLIIYMGARFSGIATLSYLMLVFSIIFASMFLLGVKLFKKIIFPLFLLFFMVPIPSQLYSAATIPLQLLVTKISVWFASLFSIPIYREGNVIHLPERTLQVVQACSGLRSIIALLALSAILAFFTLKSNKLRLILFFTGIPAAIFVNIIRVILMVIAFYYFNYDLTVGTLHTAFGVVIFFLSLGFILLFQRILVGYDKK